MKSHCKSHIYDIFWPTWWKYFEVATFLVENMKSTLAIRLHWHRQPWMCNHPVSHCAAFYFVRCSLGRIKKKKKRMNHIMDSDWKVLFGFELPPLELSGLWILSCGRKPQSCSAVSLGALKWSNGSCSHGLCPHTPWPPPLTQLQGFTLQSPNPSQAQSWGCSEEKKGTVSHHYWNYSWLSHELVLILCFSMFLVSWN